MIDKILNKFRFKDIGIVLNAPDAIEKEFIRFGFKTQLDITLKSENTLIFILNNKQYLDFLKQVLKKIEPDSVLWFAYPKGTSKIKTDINRDTIRATGELFNITTVTVISIDEIWSALRFRPVDRVGK